MIAFLIVAAFLDKLVLEKEGKEEKKQGLSFHLLLESLKHIWRSRYQKLLVPLTIYSGIEQAFIAGDFTRVCTLLGKSAPNDVLESTIILENLLKLEACYVLLFLADILMTFNSSLNDVSNAVSF